MSTTDQEASGAIHLPARVIPFPTWLSPEAQAALRMDMSPHVVKDFPAPGDAEGWRAFGAARDAAIVESAAEIFAPGSTEPAALTTIEELDVDGVRVFVSTPADWREDDPRILYNIHGGGFFMGGGDALKVESRQAAATHGVRTWSVDYRMPPDHPYPAPLDDCVTVYRSLVKDNRAEDVILQGGSAGGLLCLTTLLRAQDEGLPLPAAVAVMHPSTDLTESGDSLTTNEGLDNVLTAIEPMAQLYAQDHDRTHPYISPVYGDFSNGFPPTLITCGARDLLFSSAIRLHRRLRADDVPAELHVLECAGHNGFLGLAPEDREMQREVNRFVARHWPTVPTRTLKAGAPLGDPTKESQVSLGQEPAALRLAARNIPVPSSISLEAQAVLASQAATGPLPAAKLPSSGDLDGWRAHISEQNAQWRQQIKEAVWPGTDVLDLGAFRVYVVTPCDHAPDDDRVVLDIHGGGFICGGGELCALMGQATARLTGAMTWAVDYRMPPDHPYPTPVEDCLTAYRTLLERHRADQVIVSGGSAGGNLAAAMLLQARDEGLPMPAATVLMTPEVDLTESGDSFACNLGLDSVLTGSLMPTNLLYANGHDLKDPYVSPLFADFTKGFPPTLLVTGTRDLFLSNTVLMHQRLRAAGISADLHVLEAAGHGLFFGQGPEDAAIEGVVKGFVDHHWSGVH